MVIEMIASVVRVRSDEVNNCRLPEEYSLEEAPRFAPLAFQLAGRLGGVRVQERELKQIA